jgi:hypothetical protein
VMRIMVMAIILSIVLAGSVSWAKPFSETDGGKALVYFMIKAGGMTEAQAKEWADSQPNPQFGKAGTVDPGPDCLGRSLDSMTIRDELRGINDNLFRLDLPR